jgi:hypothetical protein
MMKSLICLNMLDDVKNRKQDNALVGKAPMALRMCQVN